jgi:calmodulin-regulated spectrin-associated protein
MIFTSKTLLHPQEDSPRRSLSSMAREFRGDTEYSPFTPDSGFGGGQNSQDELKLFHAATAAPLSSSSAINRSHDRDSSQDEEVSAAMIIGDETGLDPDALDEMERKKERILLQSLRRKQQQEEVRQRKEMEAQKRKEEERFKEEEKNRKKEEEKQRRAIILEQYKIKKAMEEAEKEVLSFKFHSNFK